jgi:hypothetical protein
MVSSAKPADTVFWLPWKNRYRKSGSGMGKANRETARISQIKT